SAIAFLKMLSVPDFTDLSRPNTITSNPGDAMKGADAATTSVQVKEKKTELLRLDEPRFERGVMRRVRNDGAERRLLEKQRSCRWIVRGVSPANLSST